MRSGSSSGTARSGSSISDWITPMKDVVRPMIEASAEAYAKEKGITPRSCDELSRRAWPASAATALPRRSSVPGRMRPGTLLVVNNIEVVYDHVILVLKGVSLAVPEGGVVALLGANGAGKTTTLKAISNLLRVERGEVTKGTIELAGDDVAALSPTELVRRGVVQVMEGRHCFEHLTVEENLLTGAYTRRDGKARDRSATSTWSTATSRACGSAAALRPATPRAASSR